MSPTLEAVGAVLAETKSIVVDTLVELARRGELLQSLTAHTAELDDSSRTLRDHSMRLESRNWCCAASVACACLFLSLVLLSYVTVA